MLCMLYPIKKIYDMQVQNEGDKWQTENPGNESSPECH